MARQIAVKNGRLGVKKTSSAKKRMATPKEKHKPTQITIAVSVAAACWMPLRGLWWLAVTL
jgi:hypothetical protein